jgi:hypothetical protein
MNKGVRRQVPRYANEGKQGQETYQVENGNGEDGQLIAFVAATHRPAKKIDPTPHDRFIRHACRHVDMPSSRWDNEWDKF